MLTGKFHGAAGLLMLAICVPVKSFAAPDSKSSHGPVVFNVTDASTGKPVPAVRVTAGGPCQMGKEFMRQVSGGLPSKGLKAAEALPVRLRLGLGLGLDIFDKAGKGQYAVKQARTALTPKGGLPVTPQTIAGDSGYFVEFVNMWGVHTP